MVFFVGDTLTLDKYKKESSNFWQLTYLNPFEFISETIKDRGNPETCMNHNCNCSKRSYLKFQPRGFKSIGIERHGGLPYQRIGDLG